MMNAANELRHLYRSAKRMAVSNDIDELLDCLLEDLLGATDFDRILLLRVEPKDLSIMVEKKYGFSRDLTIPEALDFSASSGVLNSVYLSRKPLNVVRSLDEYLSEISTEENGQGKEELIKNGNRRQEINICVSSPAGLTHFSSDENPHVSLGECEPQDPVLLSLFGSIRSFLVLPICDSGYFYGFMVADKYFSGKVISYEEVRRCAAIVSHSVNALCRAREHRIVLTKISNQLAEIEKLESFSQSIIQNLRSGLIILNHLMNIVEVNRAAEIALGYSEAELLDKPIDFLLASEQRDGLDCVFIDENDQLDSSMGMLAETFMHKKSGVIFPAEVCYSVIADQNNDIQGISCIFRDITARKAMERELARVDKLSSLGELAAGVAHEIKNPLAGIAGAIQILSKHSTEGTQHHFIFNEVLSQVNRLDSFVDGLLKFARPGRTKFRQVDLEQIMDRALFVATTCKGDKDISIQCRFREGQPVVLGDADQLQQVFLNIILNAIDAIEKRGTIIISTSWSRPGDKTAASPEREVFCQGCRNSEGHLLVSITDSGNGVDEKLLETIFNPFYSSKMNGTGLGLSISHRIVEQHGGAITLTSALGEGATFYIHLPIYNNGDDELQSA